MTTSTLNVRQVKEMLNGFLEKYEMYEDTYKKILGLPFVVSHMEELKTPTQTNVDISDTSMSSVWRERLNELSENNKTLEKQLLDATENFNLKERDWKSKLDALVESNKWYEQSLSDIVKFNETAYTRSLENDELVKTLKSQLDNALIELNILKSELQNCTHTAPQLVSDTIESKQPLTMTPENIELIVESVCDEEEMEVEEPEQDLEMEVEEPEQDLEMEVEEPEPDVEMEVEEPDVEMEVEEPEPDVEMEVEEPDVEMEVEEPDVEMEVEEPEPDVEMEVEEQEVVQDVKNVNTTDDADSVVTTETLTEDLEQEQVAPEPVVEEPKVETTVSEEEGEEEELFEIEIDEKSYCTNDDTNGFIWVLTYDGEQGEKVGYFKDGECFFYEDEQ